MEFTYHLPVNLIFGRGCAGRVGEITSALGKMALIVTGRGSTKKSGLLDRTVSLLHDAGVDSVVFDRIESNPLTTTAAEGARLAKESGCDVVIGLGGGSSMDAAKAVAFGALNSGDLSDYIFGVKQGVGALPIVLVPTTCGTGSEGNGYAVLTNPETMDKKSLRTNDIIAKASLIDPELMATMPRHVLASVGFDALAHNMEAYVSLRAQPLTDMQAHYAIGLLARSLKRVYDDPGDFDAWEEVSLASTLGGMVINMSSVGAPHGLEHPASGLRNITHGAGLAALTPEIVRRSWKASPEKYAEISRMLGGKGAQDCADRIVTLLESIGLRVTLGEQGIRREDVPWMAENCMRVSAPSIKNHPVQFSQQEIEDIYYSTM